MHLIAVIGSSPGVGKSTLCRALAASLDGSVDHFEEPEILTRQAFQPVAEEFADGSGVVSPSTLADCTRAFVAESLAAGREHVVADALLPYIPSLVAWGHDEQVLNAFMDELARAVEPADVTVVYLHDDPDTALRRAIEREDDGWIDWYVGKLARQPGTRAMRDFDSAVAHLRAEADLTRRLLTRTGWRVVSADVAGLGPDEVFARVRRDLRRTARR